MKVQKLQREESYGYICQYVDFNRTKTSGINDKTKLHKISFQNYQNLKI